MLHPCQHFLQGLQNGNKFVYFFLVVHILKCRHCLTANEQGFVLFRYLKNVCPDISLNKDTQIRNYSKDHSCWVSRNKKLISDMQIGFPMSSPNNTKPNVGGLCLVLSRCRYMKYKQQLLFCRVVVFRNQLILMEVTILSIKTGYAI